jgi:hypothetical protein
LEARDATCIVTDQPARLCIGAHYVPHSKGSEVSRYNFIYMVLYFMSASVYKPSDGET